MKNQLAADTINGVYVFERNPNIVILIDDEFLAAIPTLADFDVIYGLVSDEVASKIEREYGIH